MAVRYETRWVTPEGAAAYLREQIRNRTLSGKKVEEIARDILSGDYRQNGDTIKLGPGGEMVDGQHRAAAIVRAKELSDAHILWLEDRAAKEGRTLAAEETKPFEGVYLDFALGVPPEAQHTIDTARRRTAADVLTMRGGVNANVAIAVANWHLRYTRGNYTGANARSLFTPSQTELLAHYNADADRFQTSVARGKDLGRQKVTTATVGGMAYHVLRSEFGDDTTEEFFGPLVSGALADEMDPRLVVRNRLIRERDRFGRAEVLALLFKAWNHWGAGKRVDSIFLRNKITSANFPLPKAPKWLAQDADAPDGNE